MFNRSPVAITEVLSDENWVANLPQLLRYGQKGDVIQVPNVSVLALAEQLAAGAIATDLEFVLAPVVAP